MKLKEIAKVILEHRNKYRALMFNHRLSEQLFNAKLNEDPSDKRQDVLQKIKKGDWENPQNPSSFLESMSKSKHTEMLTHYSEGELSGMKLFKVKGYNIGFALKKKNGGYKEIVAVHNNEPEVSGIGKDLMMAAIKNGGCYLDHFDGYLTSFYESLGFKEYDRDKFDPQYDQDGSFRKKYGESDVIYRKHGNCK